MPDADKLFPIQLAIRLLLDNVSYSNPLPEWVDPLVIDYVGREGRIRKALAQYSADEMPQKAFEIVVPKKSGDQNIWVIPSVNDQIVIQACVSAIAEIIERRCIDRNAVFSCHLNTNPDRLEFLDNQVDAWTKFQIKVQQRCASDECVLQIDLKAAYESIKFELFSEFLANATDNHPATRILSRLLTTFSGQRSGVPFINNSVFFLGNAYLSEVDKIIRDYPLDARIRHDRLRRDRPALSSRDIISPQCC